MLSKLLKDISYILFPKKCCNCRVISENYFCQDCINLLEEFEPECFITRKASDSWKICAKKSSLEKVYYFYKYNNPVHQLLMDIKYSFHYDKVSEVIRLLIAAEEFQKIDFSRFNYITYIPISKRRQNWRGFNQTKLIADGLSNHLQIPYLALLEKRKNTKSQVELDRQARLKNLKNVFVAKKNIPVTLYNGNILLVDDVCTTGTTLLECAKEIKREYPDVKVYGLCFARGDK